MILITCPKSLAVELKSSIKRDKSHYEKYKYEKQWDKWQCKAVSTIYAHGCKNILSRNYTQWNPEELIILQE